MKRTKRAVFSAAIAASVSAAASAQDYLPGPVLIDPHNALADIFLPPHHVSIGWVGDSFATELGSLGPRVSTAATQIWDFSASPAGTIAADVHAARFVPNNFGVAQQGGRLARYAGGTPRDSNGIAEPGEVIPTIGQFQYRVFPLEDSQERRALPLPSNLTVKGGPAATAGPQNRTLAIVLDPTDRNRGHNKFTSPTLENQVQLLAYVSDTVPMFDGDLFLMDEGEALINIDPNGPKSLAFSYADQPEGGAVWRAPLESQWGQTATTPDPGALNALDTPLSMSETFQTGLGREVFRIGIRNPSGSFETSDAYITMSGLLRAMVDPNTGEVPQGPRWLNLGEGSYDYRNTGASTTQGKNYTFEELEQLYWMTRVDGDDDLPPSRDFIYFAQERRTNSQLVNQIQNAAETILDARRNAGFTDAAIVLVSPHATYQGASTANDPDGWQLCNDNRDAMLQVHNNLIQAGRKSVFLSLYDYTDGIFFDGRQDAIDYLAGAFPGGLHHWGDEQVDDIAALFGDLTDGPPVIKHPNSSEAGRAFAELLTRAARLKIDNPCPGDTDADNLIGPDDLFNVLLFFGKQDTLGPQEGDVDYSGRVDPKDLFLLLANFGSDCN